MRYTITIFILCLLFVAIGSCTPQTKTPPLLTVEKLDEEVVDAISRDDYKNIDARIRQGLNVNTRDKDGMTYLHKAAVFAAGNTIEALLEAGAPVNAADMDGETALNIICKVANNLALLKAVSPAMRRSYPEIDPDTVAKIIGRLLKYHADPNIAASTGAPLHSVAAWGTPEQCELLLNAGANIDACVMPYDTPLITAVIQRNMKNILYLIKRGANVNAACNASALMNAAYQNDVEIGKILIDAGADVNYSSQGYSALGAARKHGYGDFEKLLLANGAR